MGRRLYHQLKVPISMQIEVTSNCNCCCVHCYNYWRHDKLDMVAKKDSNFMSMSVAQRIVSECINNNLFSAVVTGGEPLLNFPVVKFVIDELQRNDIYVSLNTNLSLLTHEQATWIASKKVPVLTSVLGHNASLHDSITTLDGSFDKTISGIKSLLSLGIKPTVNIVASKLNIKNLTDIAEFLISLGIDYITITPVGQPSNCNDFKSLDLEREELVQICNYLLKLKENGDIRTDILTTLPLCALAGVNDILYFARRRCGVGRVDLACSCTGDLRGCAHLIGNIGNIMEYDMETIFKKTSKFCELGLFPVKCQSCKLFGLCTGGCRASVQAATGDMTNMDTRAFPDLVPNVIAQLESQMSKKLTLKRALGDSFVIKPYKIRDEGFCMVIGTGRLFKDTAYISFEASKILADFDVGKVYNVDRVLNDIPVQNKIKFLEEMESVGVLEFV